MPNYNRITLYEREEISRALSQDQSIRQIAKMLSRSPSTIYREIYRYGVVRKKFYRAIHAQQYCKKMRRKLRKNRKLINNLALRIIVLKWLRKKWSPEQISKKLRLLYPNDDSMNISHESIYSYIYILPRGTLKKRLTKYLRQHHRHRKPNNKDTSNLGAIQDFFSITERPAEVADLSHSAIKFIFCNSGYFHIWKFLEFLQPSLILTRLLFQPSLLYLLIYF